MILREIYTPICGRFTINEGGITAIYGRMQGKSPTNWGVQIIKMHVQAHLD
ncbi:DUF6783 domain-containing protein [Luxibacter massiliensis]|uniref:DUF6783 domain-containing protein n=1 Tax=Luxibacter massiliensis TaxID=2219695 RepID=UPI0027BA7508|nr:DUF6783 domain-containing protein [Luxibacter massiliensis]